MTAVAKKVHIARRNMRANEKRVEHQIAKSGSTPDPAVVSSAAKYNETLKKLARE